MLAKKFQTSVKADSHPWLPRSGVPVAFDNTEFEEGFGRFLITAKIIDQIVLERAIGAARKTGERLDRVLTKLGLVPEANLAAALSRFLSLALARPADVPLERILPDVIEADFVRRNRILPLALEDGARIMAVGLAVP